MADELTDLTLVDTILSRNLGWVAAADAKVAPALAIDTAMLGVLATMAGAVKGWDSANSLVPLVAAGLLAFSVLALALGTFPRLSGPKASLVYFGGIVAKSRDEYASKLLSAEPEELLIDLAEQCHRNAEIADAKFKWVRRALVSLFAAIPFWLIALYCIYSRSGGLLDRVAR